MSKGKFSLCGWGSLAVPQCWEGWGEEAASGGKGQATGRTQDGGEICQIILIILHITCHRTNKSLLGRNKTKAKCSHVGKKKISSEKLE